MKNQSALWSAFRKAFVVALLTLASSAFAMESKTRDLSYSKEGIKGWFACQTTGKFDPASGFYYCEDSDSSTLVGASETVVDVIDQLNRDTDYRCDIKSRPIGIPGMGGVTADMIYEIKNCTAIPRPARAPQ